ncbi:MAG: ATP-binding protein [Bacteroidales bacterium]|nr:ATP-binding protein [Bacteroidales bacterium]
MFDQSDGMNPSVRNIRNEDFSAQLSNPDSHVWELIFDSMPDMVALIDLNNIVVKANKAMRQRVNIGDQSITGHSCNKLMHDHGCTLSNCPHLSMINDRQTHSVELYEPKFDLHLNITTIPIFDAENNLLGSLHIARDISIQKVSEAKLTKLNSELNELNQSKDKFFSIVAHDLRSPFQGMLGFTDLILEDIDTLSKAEIKEYLLKVRDSAYSTFTLLENLLDWSRLQTGRLEYKPSEFSLCEDVASVISLLDSNAQSKNISLINNLSDKYVVNADRRMVHSILLNLTTNAIKFTHPGGSVSFNATIKGMCENEIGNGTTGCSHKSLQISVSDTGVGISPEGIKKIFKIDEHFTLSGTSNEQGAGLGLILVKEMTEKQGGKLIINSQEGKGSVFTFTLPLAEK